jgi:hypothetical protein
MFNLACTLTRKRPYEPVITSQNCQKTGSAVRQVRTPVRRRTGLAMARPRNPRFRNGSV